MRWGWVQDLTHGVPGFLVSCALLAGCYRWGLFRYRIPWRREHRWGLVLVIVPFFLALILFSPFASTFYAWGMLPDGALENYLIVVAAASMSYWGGAGAGWWELHQAELREAAARQERVRQEEQEAEARALKLGGIRVPEADVAQSFLVVGPAHERAEQIQKMVHHALKVQGERAVIFDPHGQYLQRTPLWRQREQCKVLALDRGPSWDFFTELGALEDIEYWAQALIAPGESRTFFARVTEQLWLAGQETSLVCTRAEWARLLLGAHASELQGLLAGTDAAGLVEGAAQVAALRAGLGAAAAALERMARQAGDQLLNLRNWIRGYAGREPGALYLRGADAASNLMLSAWMGWAMRLSLAREGRRLWFVMDALEERAPLLELSELLRAVRECNGCVVLGVESQEALYERYGAEAHAIVSACGNMLDLHAGYVQLASQARAVRLAR